MVHSGVALIIDAQLSFIFRELQTMTSNFIGVAGLPRAGSTLLCQLLAQHPELHCEGNSSPLCNALLSLRRTISDDAFFLYQLDTSFDASYDHLKTPCRACCEAGTRIVASRAWSTRTVPGYIAWKCCCNWRQKPSWWCACANWGKSMARSRPSTSAPSCSISSITWPITT